MIRIAPVWFALLVPLPLEASTFDEQTGKLSLDDAVFAYPFDNQGQLPLGATFTLSDLNERELSFAQIDALFDHNEEGLEGLGAMRFGGEVIDGTMLLPGDFVGRRVALRMWQKPNGTRASAEIYFYAGSMFGYPHYLGSIPLQPTGRVTDDGWEEWSTGPFDYAAGGVFAPTYLLFADAQVTAIRKGMYSGFEPSLSVLLDALEIVDLGEAIVPPTSCDISSERSTCGEYGVCLYGRCVDGALVVGQPPEEESRRQDYLARRIFELQTFEGGRRPQQKMPEIVSVLEALGEVTAPAQFWPEYDRAIEMLEDGHAGPPYRSYPTGVYLGICAHLGEADLTPGGGELPIVFSTTQTTLNGVLEQGDVLLAIDGLAPRQWAQTAERVIRFAGDPRSYDVTTAPQLIDAAASVGGLLTFGRCAGPTTCTDLEMQQIELDLKTMIGDPIWAQEGAPEGIYEWTICDYRFRRAVDSPNVSDYPFAGYADDAGVRTLIINGVPSYYGEGGESWFDTVYQAVRTGPGYLMLDQRTGRGGSIDAVDHLVALLMDTGDYYGADMLPWFERPFGGDLRASLRNCVLNDPYDTCGGYNFWVLGQMGGTSLGGPGASTRLAVLNARDVSGNDFVSRFLTARSAETRFFGKGSTSGAFGVIYSLPSHIEEYYGPSLQAQDTLFVADSGDDNTDFTTGYGVMPDQVVLQKQSDAVVGVDTMMQAARDWLLGGP